MSFIDTPPDLVYTYLLESSKAATTATYNHSPFKKSGHSSSQYDLIKNEIDMAQSFLAAHGLHDAIKYFRYLKEIMGPIKNVSFEFDKDTFDNDVEDFIVLRVDCSEGFIEKLDLFSDKLFEQKISGYSSFVSITKK